MIFTCRHMGLQVIFVVATSLLLLPMASAHDNDGGQPDIEIHISPQTEHWPSNYVPDGYQPEAYDGQPDEATLCQGAHGYTLSTQHVPCPETQQDNDNARRWTTHDD